MGTLKIHKPSLKTEDGRVVLQYKVSLLEELTDIKNEELWFSFDKKIPGVYLQ